MYQQPEEKVGTAKVSELAIEGKTLKIVSDGTGRNTRVFVRDSDAEEWTPISRVKEVILKPISGKTVYLEATITVIA